MPDWSTVQITSGYSCPPEDGILLPMHSIAPSRLVIEGQSGKRSLIAAGVRSDPGEGACVSGTTLRRLGSEGAAVRYRAVSLVDVFKYKPSTLVQAIVAILTFVGALISAWAGFLKAQDPTAPSFIYQTGFVVLLIALVGASWKLWVELHSP